MDWSKGRLWATPQRLLFRADEEGMGMASDRLRLGVGERGKDASGQTLAGSDDQVVVEPIQV